jgi:hypothetical protein
LKDRLVSQSLLLLIAAEGAKTEPQYFSFFNNRHATIQVNCLKGGHGSSPSQVLKRMTSWLKKNAHLVAE